MFTPRFGRAMDTFFIDPENIFMAFSARDAAERLVRGLWPDGVKTVAISADGGIEVSPLHHCSPPRKRKVIMDASPDLRSFVFVAFTANSGN